MLSRRSLMGAGASSLATSLFPGVLTQAQTAAGEISATDLGNGLALLEGAGCNVIAMPGDEGALMIDGGLAGHARSLLNAVYAATGNDSVHTLINTHWHAEQIGANALVGQAGGRIFAHENTRIYLGNTVYPESFDTSRSPLPEVARPTETTRGDGTLQFAGTRLDYGYLPQAHTDGDLYVHFPGLDLLVAGGVVSGEEWPLLEIRNGAWFGGRVRALQWLAQLVAPETRVVPAQGRLLAGVDVVRLRDIYDELFETMIGYMNRGFGPEDAAADNPLSAYESEFGDAADFVYGAYRSMLIAYVPE
ncbi:MAG TPA: MBL fold metallo-hydrolase [Gammaproteobacteria bacterium]|jgi:glyoxylase-like metal-dependent hydrolase (beta-lactamase superfamily II)